MCDITLLMMLKNLHFASLSVSCALHVYANTHMAIKTIGLIMVPVIEAKKVSFPKMIYLHLVKA